MNSKTVKISNNQNKQVKVIRVNESISKKVDSLLQKANKKKVGKSIKPNELLALALDLINENHIKKLQEDSISHEERKEHLRLIYIKKKGQITKDLFTGFMMTPEFQTFLNEHKSDLRII